MIFAIGCRGGGGQPPVTKPTQGDQPHAAQPEAPVATPVEDTAPGCKDAQSQGLNPASKAALTIMGGNGVYEGHPVFNEAWTKGEQNLKAVLAKVEQGTEEVEQGTEETKLESHTVDTSQFSDSDIASAESPKGAHHSEEDNQPIDELAITGTPQSSEHQATAAGN